MLKDEVLRYYMENGCNCAESLLMGANDYYGLGIYDTTFHALGGFGGGCYSGRLCGACAGSVAAISAKYIKTQAHEEPEARERVAEFVKAFIETLGSDLCSELKPRYYHPEEKCRKTVALAAEILQKEMDR